MTKTMLAALLFSSTFAVQAFDLISAGEFGDELEMRKFKDIDAVGATRDIPPPYPKIEIISPNLGSEIKPPVKIEVRFIGENGVAINPDSFKVNYGVLGIDITARIRKATEIKMDGFTAEGAALPEGKHSLKLTLSDAEGRTTTSTLKFKIIEAE